MSEFYGRVSGNRGPATRAGTAGSGITATAETWQSVVRAAQWMRDGCEGHSRHWTGIDLQNKGGWDSVFSVSFDGDLIVKHADDPMVKQAAEDLAQAFAALDDAAVAAEAGSKVPS